MTIFGLTQRDATGVKRGGASRSHAYRLEALPAGDVARWDDLIAPYKSTTLFHRRVWLDYLTQSRGTDIRLWTLQSAGGPVGYFCGGIVRKGPFRILGSPLKGWGTNFMGPVVAPDFDQSAFLGALDELAAREKLAMIELENPILTDEALVASGYEPLRQTTFVVPLTPGEPDKMWSHLTQRTQVRKAQKSGLVVEDTDDPAVADEFYDLFRDLMARKGLYPPYDRRSARLVFELLKPRGQLLALRVRAADGRVLSVGLFPHDDHTLYFWGGAGSPEAAKCAANDLLQWTAMEMGAARGLRAYNMCGSGFFKKKFGGTLMEPKRWHKSYSRMARWGRRAYARYTQERMRLQGHWHRRVNLRGGE